MWCPCWLGPEIEPDEGWCAHTFGFEIRQGNADGIDLSGTIVAFTGEWPANFFLGGGRARLYLDKTATEEQQRELETAIGGAIAVSISLAVENPLIGHPVNPPLTCDMIGIVLEGHYAGQKLRIVQTGRRACTRFGPVHPD